MTTLLTITDKQAQAAARCVISMRLGDELEVPDELGVML